MRTDRHETVQALAILVFVFLGLLAPLSHAQPWAGIMDPQRAIDWSDAGVRGGIPGRSSVCAVFSPGATLQQINSAIATCPAGQVVYLNSGTYDLGAGMIDIARSNVTVRGAGADQTKLVFTGRGSCGGPASVVCVRGTWITGWNNGTPQNLADWTAEYAKGSRTITLSSTTDLSPGNRVILEQLNDTADNDGVYVCGTGDQNGGGCGYTSHSGDNRGSRFQRQIVSVKSVSGTRVTLHESLHMPNWRAERSPTARWAPGVVEFSGVEDLSVQVPGPPNYNSGSNFVILAATNIWLKGVRSVYAERDHVTIYQSARVTVRDSYFYGSNYAQATSYGVEIYAASSSNLIENNIFQHNTNPVIINDSGSGTVVGYNFAIDNYRATPPELMVAFFQVHAPGAGMNLIEGNSGTAVASDNWYGTTHFMTFFRNHLYGDICGDYLLGCPTKSSQTWIMQIAAYSRFFNFVGNVLGKPNYHTSYEESDYRMCAPRDIWCLGYSHAYVPTGGVVDSRTRASAFRWGNYDTVTGAVRWNAGEVPSGLPQFANALPTTQALPPSFYLTSRPAWFGSVPFPPVGPEVLNGTVAGFGGHANKNAARLCWERAPNDTAFDNRYDGGQVKTFRASACYDVPPAPPSALTAIPGQ